MTINYILINVYFNNHIILCIYISFVYTYIRIYNFCFSLLVILYVSQ